MNLCKEEFDIKNHKHKFAVWVAGRAASVAGQRFKVELAKELIDAIALKRYIDRPNALPDNFDEEHHAWCKKLIAQSDKKISYGVAAKLINVYLKTILVCGSYHEHEKVKRFIRQLIDYFSKDLLNVRLVNLKRYGSSILKKGMAGLNLTKKHTKKSSKKSKTVLLVVVVSTPLSIFGLGISNYELNSERTYSKLPFKTGRFTVIMSQMLLSSTPKYS